MFSMMAEPGRAGEADLGDFAMAGQRRAGRRTVSQHHVYKPCRQACPHGELCHVDCREGRHFRRLQHDRIARGECRTKLPSSHRDGKIPGRDRADHAMGFAHDHAETGVVGRHELAAFLIGEFGEEADLFDGYPDVAGNELADGTGRA
jgi:hypothetical protein